MRANITYSVDEEDIRKEFMFLLEVLGPTRGVLTQESFEGVGVDIENKSYLSARNGIGRLRERLRETDIRLHEVDQMLSGYIDMLNGDSEEELMQEPEVQVDTEGV